SSVLIISNTSDAANSNTFNGTSGITSVSCSDLSYISSCVFNSVGSNHGVELTSIGSGTMTWNTVTADFDTGTTGSPVTPTSTGNEDIYITATSSSDITINVATGATIPSIRVSASFTGVVNVVAGLVDFTFTISPSLIDYEHRIYSVDTLGSLVGSVELTGLEVSGLDTYTYTYTYSTPDPIAVQFLPHLNDYEESITYYNLSPNNQSVTINLKPDINN
ncbi:MAG: hypothetical protein J7L15_00440, partial [Clostridiales bacterium]|nr:hypothetical protein [Clostridiales bacterium]